MLNNDILFAVFSFLSDEQLLAVRSTCSLWYHIIDTKFLSPNNISFFRYLYKNHKQLERFANAKKIKGKILKWQLMDNGFIVVFSYYYHTLHKRHRFVFNCVDYCGLIFSVVFRSCPEIEFSFVEFIYDHQNNGVSFTYRTMDMYPSATPHFFSFTTFRFKKRPKNSLITHSKRESSGYWFETNRFGSYFGNNLLGNNLNNYIVYVCESYDGQSGWLFIYNDRCISFDSVTYTILNNHYKNQNHYFFNGITHDFSNEFLIAFNVFDIQEFHICSHKEGIFHRPLFFYDKEKFYITKITQLKSNFDIKFIE